MRLQFDVESFDETELKLIPEFINSLVFMIQNSYKQYITLDKIKKREKSLLESNVIKWNTKQTKINYNTLISCITNSIISKKFVNSETYIITIDEKIKLPLTDTKIGTIIKLLDKGNEKVKPIDFGIKIYNFYKENIPEYWRTFLISKLGRTDLFECLRI